MTGYWLLLLHFVGDYVTQSDWMANEKMKGWFPAICHAVVYTLPFALIMPDWEPLLLIGGTHVVIDHYRLARHVCWVKNLVSPRSWHFPWGECKKTGYSDSVPPFLSLWLMIIVDNTMHIGLNGLAWHLWGVA